MYSGEASRGFNGVEPERSPPTAEAYVLDNYLRSYSHYGKLSDRKTI